MKFNSLFDYYTRKNLSSFLDALIPRTPELANEIGAELVNGVNDTQLSDQIKAAFDHIQSPELLPEFVTESRDTPEELPTSHLLAFLLDLGAVEYILKGKLSNFPGPAIGGPFCWLSRDDRIGVMDHLSDESTFLTVLKAFKPILPHVGLIDFLLDGATTMALMNYYSEWSGYSDSSNPLYPDPETFEGSAQGWDQTNFPGREKGYPALRGYEVDEYQENDWT